jgi:RNA polymerase sigma-70 factor (ECF subfamily)
MVALRLDQRLHGRIDASDVIQEAYLEAWHRLPEYLRQPTMPFFLWLRFLTGQVRSRCTVAPCQKRLPPRWPHS